MSSQLAGGSLDRYASLIGKEVQASGPTSYSGSGAVTLYPDAASGAATALLVVTNAAGVEVAHLSAPTTGETISWSGQDGIGAQMLAGSYSYALEGYDAEGAALCTFPVRSYDRIAEVQNGDSGVTLVFSGGDQIAAGDVTALRAAE